jgi:hypothetical protein
MNHARVLYHLVRADFLERVRRYSFLLTLAGTLYLGYGVATEKVWVVIGNGYRGVYNAAWIGALMAICCSTFLSLAGFYVVKNSLERDATTRVGQILAATPMRKTFYTLAKGISNFAVLASMIAILMAAALVMLLLRAEGGQVSLWKLWSPFLLLALPAMALAAALAVLFETLPLLRSGVGNVVYFFVWTFGLAMAVQAGTAEPTGLQLLFQSTRAALLKVDPNSKDSFSLTIGGTRAVRTFFWGGFDWTASMVMGRIMWVAVAAGVALLGSVFFHRFDPAYEWWGKKKTGPQAQAAFANGEVAVPASTQPSAIQPAHLTPIAAARGRFRFPQLVVSEMQVMLKGQRWWWYIAALGLVIAGLSTPAVVGRGGVLVAAWLWPILLWSQMGSREIRYGTHALIFSSQRALGRQLPAVWAAGVMVALLTGAGVGVRLLQAADWHGMAALLAGALFIPSLALALGVWSGTSKLFEAIYTVWWYMGPANHDPQFDFMGTTQGSSRPVYYLAFAAALIAAAYFGRRVRMAYA